MTSDVYVALHTVSLIFGIALVLWGLQIFRVYIIFFGVVLGGLLGTVIGDTVGLRPVAGMLTTIAGVLLGAGLAWPLQRFYLFAAVGTVFGLAGAAAMATMHVPPELCLVAGATLFTITGAIGVTFFKHVVLILMAFAGAHRIFSLVFQPHGFQIVGGQDLFWRRMLAIVVGPYPSANEATWKSVSGAIVDFYSPHALALMFISLVCICFAWYFQKTLEVRRAEGDWRTRVIRSRRATYLVAFLAVAGYPLSQLLNRPIESSALLGVDAVTWPLVALAVGLFSNWLLPRGHEPHGLRSTGVFRFLAMLVFCILVIPLITWGVWCVLLARSVPPWYREAFLVSDLAWLMIKRVCTLVVLPGLVYLTILRESEGLRAELGAGLMRCATLLLSRSSPTARQPIRHGPRNLAAPERGLWSDQWTGGV